MLKHFLVHTQEPEFARCIEEMLAGWGIKKEQLHLIVRDNAANMVKAMADAGYPNLGCFAHTLQLIVHEGVLSQRSVKDTVAICRQIVGHFKRSPLAVSRLKEMQKSPRAPTTSTETRCSYQVEFHLVHAAEDSRAKDGTSCLHYRG